MGGVGGEGRFLRPQLRARARRRAALATRRHGKRGEARVGGGRGARAAVPVAVPRRAACVKMTFNRKSAPRPQQTCPPAAAVAAGGGRGAGRVEPGPERRQGHACGLAPESRVLLQHGRRGAARGVRRGLGRRLGDAAREPREEVKQPPRLLAREHAAPRWRARPLPRRRRRPAAAAVAGARWLRRRRSGRAAPRRRLRRARVAAAAAAATAAASRCGHGHTALAGADSTSCTSDSTSSARAARRRASRSSSAGRGGSGTRKYAGT